MGRAAPVISVVSADPLNPGLAAPQPFEGGETMVYCPAARGLDAGAGTVTWVPKAVGVAPARLSVIATFTSGSRLKLRSRSSKFTSTEPSGWTVVVAARLASPTRATGTLAKRYPVAAVFAGSAMPVTEVADATVPPADPGVTVPSWSHGSLIAPCVTA